MSHVQVYCVGRQLLEGKALICGVGVVVGFVACTLECGDIE
jgi:hypothetical protein